MRHYTRSALLLILGIVVGTIGVMALRPSTASMSSTRSAQAESGITPIENALERNIPEVWIDRIPLDQAVVELSRLGGVPIQLDVKRMRDRGLPVDGLVTVRRRNADLMSALDTLTGSYSEQGMSVVWAVVGDGVLVTVWGCRDDVATVITRVYDISPLAPEAKKPDPSTMPAGCFFGPPDTRDDLVRLLQETVKPVTWREYGGRYGSVARLGNRLIVAQSVDGHVLIRRLLGQLIATPAPLAVEIQPSAISKESWTFHPTLKRWVSMAEERADAGLWRVVPSFEVKDMPLPESLERLALAAEFDVLIHAQSFDATLDPQDKLPDRKITLSMRGVPAWRILREILDQAAGTTTTRPDRWPAKTSLDADNAAASPPFTWWLDGGVVVVGRTQYAELRTRVYDTRNFFDRSLAEPVVDISTGRKTREKSKEEFAEELMRLLIDQIDPASWRDNGGRLGSIRELSRQLLVTQTWENHEHIRPLIDQLTRAPATRPVPPQPTAK